MSGRLRFRWFRWSPRAAAALLAGALLGLPAVPAAAQAPAPSPAVPAGCTDVLPVGELTRGQRGHGLTVTRGDTPERFEVEVLGVLSDAIGPGRDMIVVDVSGAIVDAAGGTLWSGSSGSPVYVNDRLIGAVAYGLSAGPSTITGLTPAEDMIELLGYPSSRSFQSADQGTTPSTASNSEDMRERIASRYGISPSQVGTSFRQMRTPLSVSGVSRRSMDRLVQAIERTGVPLVPYVGSSAPAQATTATRTPRAGGNFAAALSYGDVTAAAVGTTTYVCDGQALAFGHPFTWSGGVSFGANDASTITIVDDPLFGAYKMANLSGGFGTVDQDRLAGVRTRLGTMPAGIPITSEVTDEDLGRARTGTSSVTTSSQVPFIALMHALTNIDMVVDRIGPGSSSFDFVVRGERENGRSWTLRRENRHASTFDVSFDSITELLNTLFVIQENPLEAVTFTGIEVTASVEEPVRRYTLAQLQVAQGEGDDAYVPVGDEPIHVEPGQSLRLRAVLSPYRSTERVAVDFELPVPADAAGDGFLQVTGGTSGGEDPFLCLFDPAACGGGEEGMDFPDLLAALEDQPRNDELVATLQLFGPGFGGDPGFGGESAEPAPGEPAPGAEGSTTADEPVPGPGTGVEPASEARIRLDQVVTGARGVSVFVRPAGTIQRIAGADRVGTAVALSEATRPFADAVVLARADDPTDALTGGPLAASLDAPLLLTSGGALSPAAAQEIQRLGARRALILGGTGALSAQVEQDLRSLGLATVERIAGANRFETARLVANEVGGAQVFLTGATSWVDAVAASGAAALSRSPILLTERDALPTSTEQALRDLATEHVVVVGGGAAVSAGVADALQASGLSVERVAGASRYETSLRLAELATSYGADAFDTWLVSGEDFPDALAAAPAVASRFGVLLMVAPDTLDRSQPAREWLGRLAGGPWSITLVGGERAISAQVEQQVADAVSGFGPGPEPQPVGQAAG